MDGMRLLLLRNLKLELNRTDVDKIQIHVPPKRIRFLAFSQEFYVASEKVKERVSSEIIIQNNISR